MFSDREKNGNVHAMNFNDFIVIFIDSFIKLLY